ncbi:S-adenosyl-L-methionine-dependent methyltransferase [Lineolata rhizophorae]|uniref:DNA (cytosine-5-)-methyltransferase n=1 Tax=Lineolata rhizophorae TaxID=578093 RepID=A0A6A6P167_9PEZI|nr:S-adenosyl-L-methionine-dependent methyltransferase [Lineolata rhizophorae]
MPPLPTSLDSSGSPSPSDSGTQGTSVSTPSSGRSLLGRRQLQSPATSQVPSSTQKSTTRKRSADAIQEAASRGPKRAKTADKLVVDGKLDFPRATYLPFAPPGVLAEEHKAIKLLLSEHEVSSNVSFTLSNFTIYKQHSGEFGRTIFTQQDNGEMESLNTLRVKMGIKQLYFNGLLSVGDVERYVENVKFEKLSIGGYFDPDVHTYSDVWIQSRLCQDLEEESGNRSIWYRLDIPAKEYRRFWEPFQWLATFAKYFIDYIDDNDEATIADFRYNFYAYIKRLHGSSRSFKLWLDAYGSTDFRQPVVRHITFLWTQTTCSQHPKLRDHPIWAAIDAEQARVIKWQGPRGDKASVDKAPEDTVVTPFVHEVFKEMYFGERLQMVAPSEEIYEIQQRKKEELGLAVGLTGEQIPAPVGGRRKKLRAIRVGDVIGVPREEKTGWRDRQDVWFAYVHGVRKCGKNNVLDIVWLYRPADTPLANMNYPLHNELFFSDHCNCNARTKTLEKDVVSLVTVEWFSNNHHKAGAYFIRQKYISEEYSFVTVKESDLKYPCSCKTPGPETNMEDILGKYRVGDTIYIGPHPKLGSEWLEPALITDFQEERVVVQRFLRRPAARPNELVLATRKYGVSPELVSRQCHVRFFTARQVRSGIPPPYNRDGRGDFWYFSYAQGRDGVLEELESAPSGMIQGYNPSADTALGRPLRTLDLFCGGGNFGRGVEEGGGAVRPHWAVDYEADALHTYLINAPRKKDAPMPKCFLGSANTFKKRALAGDFGELVAPIQEVDAVLAGSPCQGFSAAQLQKVSTKSLVNASMVASVVSFIDLYSPKYALLENVLGMSHKNKAYKEQNVFSQILCGLVALGYQVTQFNLDAWSFGEPQSRSRLIISIAAPGLTPLDHPAQTHSHPAGTTNSSLGLASNGEHFGNRRFPFTPFQFVSAGEAMADLPRVGDARPQICIRRPDHILSLNPSIRMRNLLHMVPTVPRQMGLLSSAHAGLVAQHQLDWNVRIETRLRRNSRSYTRVHPRRLVPTVTTKPSPADSYNGKVLHWDEPRVLTVMEARRAQGFPDDELILGLPASQWKIIGNSVARGVSMGLGLSLRKALVGHLKE